MISGDGAHAPGIIGHVPVCKCTREICRDGRMYLQRSEGQSGIKHRVSCNKYPECRNTLWLPSTVVEADVSDECASCSRPQRKGSDLLHTCIEIGRECARVGRIVATCTSKAFHFSCVSSGGWWYDFDPQMIGSDGMICVVECLSQAQQSGSHSFAESILLGLGILRLQSRFTSCE